MKTPSFLQRIIELFSRLFGVSITPDIQILQGRYYTIRVLKDFSDIQNNKPLKIADLAYHKVETLHYWSEVVKNSDIELEETNQQYKVRYLFLSAWSITYKVEPSSVPENDLKHKQYTHVFCIWKGGRFKSGKLVLGQHLVSVPLNLGMYGNLSAAAVAFEASKSLLQSSDFTQIDWRKELQKQRYRY